MTGRVMKATGGYYYVESGDGEILECRARGLFRKDGISPCVGDIAGVRPDGGGSGTVTEIMDRKNILIRPSLANLDYMVYVLSVADPFPNLFVTDKFLAVLEYKDIPTIIAVTKSDLGDADRYIEIYEKAGYPVYVINNMTGEGAEHLSEAISGKLCAFSGNSGVGKSSLLNAIDSRFSIATGETSKKLGRGRHTTRHVELFKTANHALIADTPGFSTVEILKMSDMDKISLPLCFREFAPFLGKCRFNDCSHTSELGCSVLDAVRVGEIGAERHRSYLELYNEVKDLKDWQRSK